MDQHKDHNQESLPNFLKDLDKKALEYPVPEGFFDNMQKSILSEINEVQIPKKGKTVSFWLKAVSIAAIVVIAIMIGSQSNTSENNTNVFVDLSDEDMQWYMDNYTADWSSDDVLAMMENDPIEEYTDIIPLTTIELEETDVTEMIEHLDDDVLINYDIEE